MTTVVWYVAGRSVWNRPLLVVLVRLTGRATARAPYSASASLAG